MLKIISRFSLFERRRFIDGQELSESLRVTLKCSLLQQEMLEYETRKGLMLLLFWSCHLGWINEKVSKISEKAILALLRRDAFFKLDDAFDEQNANIAVVNLTHGEYEDLFSAYFRIYRTKKYEL